MLNVYEQTLMQGGGQVEVLQVLKTAVKPGTTAQGDVP